MTLWRDEQGRERAKYAAPVVAHRNLVVGALVDAWRGADPLTGPVLVQARLSFPRPKSHYRTGRYSDQLKDGAPTLHTQYPDLDKCLRLLFDALTVAGVWADDNQACDVRGYKRWGAGLTELTLYRKD
jgi:crossover junction endodeoxyribonuclease RusA